MSDQQQPSGPPVGRVSLEHTGLERFVGPLEATILLAVWDMVNPTLAEIHNYILVNEDVPLSYSTIATTVGRLHTKGLLLKQAGTPPIYTAKYVDVQHFILACLTALFIELLTDYGTDTIKEAVRRATAELRSV